MKIAIEDVQQWLAWRSLWNNTPLEKIEFTLEGKDVDIEVTEQILDDQNNPIEICPITKQQFKRWGLANVDYLLLAVESLKRSP